MEVGDAVGELIGLEVVGFAFVGVAAGMAMTLDVMLDDTGVRPRLLKLTLKKPSLIAQYFPHYYYRLLRLLLQMSF